jgi:hypothetical protein
MNERRLVLIVGVGRSGTSLLAGILGQLGIHVPQPEVVADATNPRGFGEPRWVVDFHRRLMRRPTVNVHVFDARPEAFGRTAAAGEDPATRLALRTWLGAELAAAEAIVVKDPRSGWFLPLWMDCSSELGAQTSCVTMLRHPAEILVSARRSYGTWQADTSRAAGWLNQMLETERATRDRSRAFIRYEDLLADWAGEVRRAGAQIGLPRLAGLDGGHFPAIEAFVDPTLHRNRVSWDEAPLPPALLELVDEAWDALQVLSRPDGDDARLRARLDAAHAAYRALYADAELIAESSIIAARPRRVQPPASPRTLGRRMRSAIAGRIPLPLRQRLKRSAKRR